MITLNLRIIIMFFTGFLFTDTLYSTVPHNSPPITIWVHGTKLLFSKYFLQDFFHTKPGLCPASMFDPQYHARTIAECLSKSCPERFPFETFYFFGWDGKLSFESRANAAKDLYNHIKQLRTEYIQKYGHPPFLCFITHSHGGNVLLAMIEEMEKAIEGERARIKQSEDIFTIDEAILLACPIQKRTAHLIGSPFFTNVCSVFSTLDSLQVADPQKIHYWWNYMTGKWDQLIKSPFFSERTFPAHDNLTQIKISFDSMFHISRGLMHIEFLLTPFLMKLGVLLDTIEKQSQHPHNAPSICSFVIKSN